MGVISSLATAWRSLRWFSRNLMGDSAYENYVRRHEMVHPDHPPMTEKEFWRSRDDFNEDNVQSGCC
ncbi:YbdD/YjiX family protein [Actinomycetaceae bacterium WB03_NA08]|uniref:YbdD/YjiX family protein n=1 Tax=Scrofimicrobium canadense TaxID=2652290 RepID=A0A6N7W988_9ACTO|nr:YbdD/YjiX family protein [Scrofimicrobium canadense]MSS85033.1 YbdD/YjiX family protein [Scrofimicrobium canadense]